MGEGLLDGFVGWAERPAQPQRAAKQRKAFEEGDLRHGALKRAKSRKAFEEGDLRHGALKKKG